MSATIEQPLKLNIGSGLHAIEGFTSIDRKLGGEAYPLQYADESAAEILASHILEHFGHQEVPHVLRDWVRVLKPGGLLRLAVPDFDWIASNTADRKRFFYLMGGQRDADDFHKSVFTKDSLVFAMENAGLTAIQPWTSQNGDCSSLPCSLNLQGTKRLDLSATTTKPPEDNMVKMRGIVSVPRLGFTAQFGCVHAALDSLKIRYRQYTGAYWHHGIQNGIEDALADELDWLLFMDYDTLFTPANLSNLLQCFGEHGELDALAALQCRRAYDQPLFHGHDPAQARLPNEPIVCRTAHFGMTLLRLDAMKGIPKPWFIDVPGPDGSYQHPQHRDPDVSFWDLLGKHGKRIAVAPHVKVAHIEDMCSIYDEMMQRKIESVWEWRKRFNNP